MSAIGALDVRGPSVQALSRRVALTTTAIVGGAYAVIAIAVAVIVANYLVADIDRGLARFFNGPGDTGPRPAPNFRFEQPGPRALPILVWRVHADGTVDSSESQSVALPAQYQHVTGPQTVTLSDGSQWRMEGEQVGEDYVVVAQSMDQVGKTMWILVPAEIGIGATLVLVVFLGALAIGRRVAQPIEDARQRQLEFTADASHELRTPLSVIEAQTSLALARPRPPEWYRTAFDRVDGEARRMRRLVEDMLWLARFDATRGQPHAEPVDVTVMAAATADRFRAVAETRRLTLAVRGDVGAIVTVPPEWLDRLLGVLLDNACKYAPDGGQVLVEVGADAKRVRLAVDDSGAGIPPEERERIFDRFHRATNAAGGAGLGLAIGDAIVRATNGRWQIGASPLGGASIAVSWPRSMAGRQERRAGEPQVDTPA